MCILIDLCSSRTFVTAPPTHGRPHQGQALCLCRLRRHVHTAGKPQTAPAPALPSQENTNCHWQWCCSPAAARVGAARPGRHLIGFANHDFITFMIVVASQSSVNCKKRTRKISRKKSSKFDKENGIDERGKHRMHSFEIQLSFINASMK